MADNCEMCAHYVTDEEFGDYFAWGTTWFCGLDNNCYLCSEIIKRGTDEVIRLVQSPRLEPHRKVNIRHVVLGQNLKDGFRAILVFMLPAR